ATAATMRQVASYYSALEAAEKAPRDPNALETYRDAGIALVNSYCRSWFAQLDDFSRNLSQTRSHHGVLSALGTALIGVGKLDADVTAVYGALNTAYTGALDTAAKSYLFSASSTTVENKVFKHLNDRAKDIRDDSPTEFGQMRNALEAYERICTFKHAAALVEESVKQTETTVDENGAIKTIEFGFDEASDALRVLWKPDGSTINDDFAQFAKNWLTKNGLPPDVSSVIYDKAQAKTRRGLLEAYAESKKRRSEERRVGKECRCRASRSGAERETRT